MKRLLAALVIALVASTAIAAVPGDAAIRKILTDRVDVQHQGVGIVAGVIEPSGRRVIAYGTFDKGDKRNVNGDTVYEIGSMTKVFTSLLLADMAARGEVALGDPISKYLPAEVKVPERGGRKITLRDLASHTSGLPRLPANLLPKDNANPYADYTVQQMYDALGTIELASDPGTKYDYSNFGVGLLGHILARRAGMDYEKLLRKRVLEPLGMKDTSITLAKSMKDRLAPGHDENLQPAANWDLPSLAGAGALRSTANDMLKFLAAVLGYTKTPLNAAMHSMVATAERHPTGTPNTDVALAWHILTSDGREVMAHGGGTGGYRSYMAYDPKQRVGVVVLSNTSTTAGVDEIGRQLLGIAAAPARPEVKVDAKVLERYVGRYELAPGFIITITREGEHLFLQATGQPRFELFAESETNFFLKVVDAQVTFEDGALVLHQNGDRRAKRIEGEPTPPKEFKEVAVDPKIFANYVGKYALAPAFVLDVTTDGEHLFVQATGQMKLQVYPSSEREFFYKVVDAQITFITDDAGRATSLVLHQNGMDAPGKRQP